MMNNFVKVSLPLKQNEKQMTTSNANQSGTGVFYQAMPAVGADGKNVMKLIPVQRVNGQFVQMQTSNNLPSIYKKADLEPQRLFARPIHLSPNPVSHSNVPILQPAISGRYILKRPSDVNVMVNPVGTEKYNESVTVSTSTQIQVQSSPIRVQSSSIQVQRTQIQVQSSPVRRTPIQVQGSPIHIQRTPIHVQGSPIHVQRTPIQVQRTPIQVQVPVPIVATKVAQNVPLPSPVLNCGKTLTLLNKKQFPVTVKSPVLPNGHYLQIPPNAQVKTFPASALPQAIKKRILTPPISSTASSMPDLSTVVYVSPVNTLKLGTPPQAPKVPHTPLPLSPFSKPPAQSLAICPATNSTQLLKSVPKETRDPVTPIKWVVQERSDSARPCLVPQNSSCMTSEILRALAQMESVQNIGQDTATTPPPLPDKLTPIGPGKDNALVMCNGKVYFVAKKTPEFSDHSPQIQKVSGTINSSPKHTIGDGNINQKIKGSSLNLLTNSFPGVTSPRQDSGHIVINDGPDDIIDLCDDDPQDEVVSQSAASQPAADEDEDSNVIFVSYIPPTSTESAGNEMQVDQEREVVQENATTYKAVLEQESFQERTISQEKESGQEKATSQENPEEVNQSIAVQEAQIQQNMEACQEKQNETEKDSVPSIPAESVKSSVDPCSDRHIEDSEMKTRREQDRQLKWRFGITSDVKICLQRIDLTESKAITRKGQRIGSINKRTLDGIRKLMQGSRIELKTKKYVQTLVLSMKEKDECSPHDPKRKKVGPPKISDTAPGSVFTCTPHCTATETAVERAKTPSKAISSAGSEAISSTGSEAISSTGSEAISSAGSETSTRPLETSEPEKIVKQDVTSSSSPAEEIRTAMVPNVQEAEIGMEDHGVKSRNIPKSKTVQPRSPKGKGKQCRLPEAKSEEETLDQEQMEISAVPTGESNSSTTKGTKMKAPAEVVVQEEEPTEEPASVEICCPSTLSESSCSAGGEPLAGDLFTAAPMDSEEIKRHEKIKRLKELLKEKEAALEMIRKNMI